MSDMELKLPVLFRPKGHEDDLEYPYSKCAIKPMIFFNIDNVDEEVEEDKSYARFSSGGDTFVCNLSLEGLMQRIRIAKVEYLELMNNLLNKNV